MTNKIKYLSLLIVGLILAIFFALQDEEYVSSRETASFALPDSVDKLVFNQTVIEQVSAEVWKMNQQTEIDPLMLQSLLTVLSKVEIKRPVSASVRDKVLSAFLGNGVTVKMFSDDKLLRTYLVTEFENETYAMFEKGEPYSVYIPGYPLNLRQLLNFEESDWKDRTIFRTSVRSLKKISVVYTEKPAENLDIEFRSIAADSGYFNVKGVENPDNRKLARYIQQFENTRSEGYKIDSLTLALLGKAKPYCQISLEDINPEQNNQLNVYIVNKQIFGFDNRNKMFSILEPALFRRVMLVPQDLASQQK